MTEIVCTPAEVANGTLLHEHRDAAVAALHEDGFVVLKNVVDVAHLDVIEERMLADVEAVLARPDAPFNFNTGNVQQAPPPFHPYLFRDILFNEQVIAVTRHILGDGLKNSYYSGNTAIPGGTRQPVHPDIAQLWPGLTEATPPFGLVVNIPVTDMNPANGSTEFWPGTHRDCTYSFFDGSLRVPDEELARWRTTRPAFQPTVSRGDAIIRDIRMWHAGMPNTTERYRIMIAMIHFTKWWNDSIEIAEFPEEARPFFNHPVLRTNARFSDSVDHIQHAAAYDLHKGSSK